MAESENMRVLVLVVALLATTACKESKSPTAEDASASASGSASAAPCGTVGGSCTREGATCAPAPIGTDWSHILSCHSGKWTELEVVPLPTPATATTAAASASAQGRTQAAPRSLPKVDVTCNTDADCVITSDEVQDDAPRTYACCPGCTQRAVNAPWYKVFQSACATSPAPQCPPIGCAMAVMKSACKAHRCELVTPAK